jgi:cytochrome c-type biogenesis protein CcmH
MIFWLVAAALTMGCLLLVFAPMIRGAGAAERRASYDLQIYRDQLQEIDRDVARGVITPEEAADTRVEVSRKLLAAADAEAREAAAGRAPRQATRAGGAVAGLGALALAAWAYTGQGAPGYDDQPLAERLARLAEARANRPAQAEVEQIVAEGHQPRDPAEAGYRPEDLELVDRLQALLEERPDDLEGHLLLVRSLGALGRFAEARAAQERVVGILGDRADAEEHVGLAELMIAAAGGYVSPEAEAALARALEMDPMNPPARYYSGLTLLQGGRPDLAYRLWAGLLEEGPPDAPWVRAIETEIDDVALMAGLPPPGAGLPGDVPAPAPGGMEEATPPAAALPPGATMPEPDVETAMMIEGMVASLGARLAAEGGSADEWAQLIRSLGVLGRIGEAAAIWSEAQDAFASDQAALAMLREAARDARLVQ